jgi:hypothetical protein
MAMFRQVSAFEIVFEPSDGGALPPVDALISHKRQADAH